MPIRYICISDSATWQTSHVYTIFKFSFLWYFLCIEKKCPCLQFLFSRTYEVFYCFFRYASWMQGTYNISSPVLSYICYLWFLILSITVRFVRLAKKHSQCMNNQLWHTVPFQHFLGRLKVDVVQLEHARWKWWPPGTSAGGSCDRESTKERRRSSEPA